MKLTLPWSILLKYRWKELHQCVSDDIVIHQTGNSLSDKKKSSAQAHEPWLCVSTLTGQRDVRGGVCVRVCVGRNSSEPDHTTAACSQWVCRNKTYLIKQLLNTVSGITRILS